jgi:C1A family cysteine protease
MRVLSLVFALAATTVSAVLKGTEKEDLEKFTSFVEKYNKSYDTMEEFQQRFKIFQTNLEVADARNVANMMAGGDEAHGVTQFSDLTQDEFQRTFLMKPGFYKPRVHENRGPIVRSTAGATTVDWRNTPGVVTAVKNQAQCGSCWAFSATEAIESFTAIAGLYYKNTTVPLSASQSCGCTYVYDGCDGGNPQDVYVKAIDAHGGAESEQELPYSTLGTHSECGSCGVTASAQRYADVSKTSYTNAPRGSLQDVLDSTGPPSVCVAAESWNSYTGGVLSNCPGTVDHCVQAVGYEIPSTGKSYWLVRNSWGETWGNKGYIWLDMAGDTCQIESDINYPKPIPVPNL